MTVLDQRTRIEFPAGFDARALLRPTLHSSVQQPGRSGAPMRRAITSNSPLRFALVYLGHRMRQQDSPEVVSFNPLHLDLCRSAARWPKQPSRDIWVAPRGAGKTEWLFLTLPLWAIAHGHRSFFLAFSYNKDQAVGHLANLRMELAENALLRDDFPELAPRRMPGARNTATTVVVGGTIEARGLGETVVGRRSRSDRPDLIVGDDLEPLEADYSPAAKLKLQGKLTDGILPMTSRHAVVALSGTVTMRGSMVHDAVASAKGERTDANRWVTGNGFTVRHYRPIVDGASLWPQRWSVAELEEMKARDPRGYGLNMECDPDEINDDTVWWTQADFRYDPRFAVHSRVLWVDTATTARSGSDSTVLALVAKDAAGRRACVEHVTWGQWRPEQTREQIHAMVGLCGDRPPLIIVEGNQGGDTWKTSLAPWPLGVRFEIRHATEKKSDRIEKCHNAYAGMAVVHARRIPRLEAEMCLWPHGEHDDVPDAVAGGVQWALNY